MIGPAKNPEFILPGWPNFEWSTWNLLIQVGSKLSGSRTGFARRAGSKSLKGIFILLTPFFFVGIDATQRISPFRRFDSDKGFFLQAIANFNVLPSPSTSRINPQY